MPKLILPPKLKKGDNIRIIAPSCSGQTISKQRIKNAQKTLEQAGFVISFGKNVFEMNDLQSSSVESRLEDLHSAFLDQKVSGILAIRGGYNANDLLDYVDWNIIKNNPKVYCGYSDNTALQNAILAKTGLVTYSGPNFSTFGNPKKLNYTLNNFLDVVCSANPMSIKNLNHIEVINPGKSSGGIIGGNLCTLNLLQGTEYMPSLNNQILFIEDDFISNLDWWEFTRNLQSLINLPDFNQIRGLVIGKFDSKSRLPISKIRRVIKSKPELNSIPVIANLNFGHVLPMFTFPIGGKVNIDTTRQSILIIA